MWRIAVCVVAGSGFVVACAGCYLYLADLSNQESPWLAIPACLAGCLLWPCFIGLLLAFIFSRLFLVVEAFISMRSLPIGAYSTVSWVGFLPHIGS
jgi:TRAP-type C4-dicarboxylate transport system permease small subunit